MNEKLLKIGVHTIAWIVFFMLPFVLFPKMNIRLDMLVMSLLPNLVLVAYFYINLNFLVPRYLLKKRNLLFFLFTILAITLYILLTPHPDFKQHIPPGIHMDQMKEFNQNNMPPRPNLFIPFISISLFLLVFALSTGIKILEELFDAKQKKQFAETAKSKAELATLKSQINPHFLFNTLNGIYSLSIENSPKTPDAIMRLSGMMRYILTESESEFVPLQIEIDYLKQYIELQELRITNKTKVHFSIEGIIENIKIAPLLIEPFIENAFKYGVSVSDESNIEIAIKTHKSDILFSIRNRLCNFGESGSKLGIANVKQRLQILYPNSHQLSIKNQDGFFIVTLEIKTA